MAQRLVQSLASAPRLARRLAPASPPSSWHASRHSFFVFSAPFSSAPATATASASSAPPQPPPPPPQPLPSTNEGVDVSSFRPAMIRNFSIIAHIDHGKSTLADRLLEITGTVIPQGQAQVLDRLQVERERGITVKAQTATLFHTAEDGQRYLLNLIDTPGHVDFNYEVSCSLAACQGTLLIVDASQGVQAQTLANFYLAFDRDVTIIPVVNKVDLPTAQVENSLKQMESLFDFAPKDAILVSAKTGLNIQALLSAIVARIPPPKASPDKPLRALLFDSWYDDYRGVVSLVEVRALASPREVQRY
jgi:elongation factor 4